MEIIKTAGLTKYYGRARGIIDVDLSVEQGECFGFIGPNGAGKSTTIRTLLGLISPTSGSAQVLGRDIVKEKKEILREVGFLPSEAMFYSGMKVRDIIKFSADLRKKDCSAEAKRLCERLQLDTTRKVDDLSFGNRKKVAIVCALQSKPSLIILDEPTGGLDPLMQREFFDIIKERNAAGATVFLSSHILSEVQRNCTRAAVIKDGRIIACDRVEALAQTGAKRVSVYGEINLDGLEGVKDIKTEGENTVFLYSGEIGRLLGRLSESAIGDVNITEPDLEEVFLHYYEKEGEQA
ncbi:MAG: ABC transporter ATP-binding protein [Clostridia bacterium]|nr:ABC transporter ATP-binding protein [Clostridia bacterium]